MTRENLRTPCYIIKETALRRNLEILKGVRERTGCRILLAQKAFSFYKVYPLMAEYLDGTAASGLYEARLGAEEMGLENHIFSPAFVEGEFEEIVSIADHIVFNSLTQLRHFGMRAKEAGKSVGIRVNPQCSTQEGHEIYDPCSKNSRLGVLAEELEEEYPNEMPECVQGLHFHTLCEQNADALAVTLRAFEQKFHKWLCSDRLKWINFGGGHHITREDYDIELLEKCILHIKETYGVEVYLEPGEAVALNAGDLLTEVVDIVHENKEYTGMAILDASAACHMPDVIEMPYRPPLADSGRENEFPYSYLLGGPTCLAGDQIGVYSFNKKLHIGERLTFLDMAIYTMVKTNTFNGMKLPDIVWEKADGQCEVVRHFGYEDFKERL